jgi:hypothetical protein
LKINRCVNIATINSANVLSKWKDACKKLCEKNYLMAKNIMNDMDMDDIKILDKINLLIQMILIEFLIITTLFGVLNN